MKKYLLLLTFIILTFKSANSQTNVYHPFPDSSVMWTGTYWYVSQGSGYCTVHNDYNLYISGDTTIGNYSYHKLYSNRHNYANCPPPGDYHYGIYSGVLRQDIANKKIYSIQNDADTLVYDFNLNLGDTLPVTSLNDAIWNNYITSIDSVLVGNQYRKRFWISCNTFNGNYNNYVALIEGVGSTFGVFAPIKPNEIMLDFSDGYELWCMSLNNQDVWPDTQNTNCDLILTIENNITDNKIFISKNPFSSETTLNSVYILKNAILTLSNSLGQEVKRIKNICGQTITLSRDNLSGGLYFFSLTQDNKTILTGKLIITD